MMSGFGAKLSRHVLGMKFMRKTKDQADKEKVEKVHRQHFAPASVKSASVTKTKNEQSGSVPPSSTSSVEIEELWSYNQCERYIFGRQSFGGFNPIVENNVKKGIWKPFYLDKAVTLQSDEEEEEEVKKQSDVDVSDEEMAKTYGSLVGTLAKHFQKKFKKDKPSNAEQQEEPEEDESETINQPAQKKKWNKRFQRGKNKQGPSNQNRFQEKYNQEEGQCQNQRGRNRKGPWQGKGNDRKRQRESTGSAYNSDSGRSRNQKDFGNSGMLKKSPFSIPGHSRRQEQEEDVVWVPPNKRKRFMKPADD